MFNAKRGYIYIIKIFLFFFACGPKDMDPYKYIKGVPGWP